MWLELVPIIHTDAMRNLAAVRQFSCGEKHGVALQLQLAYVLVWNLGAVPLLVDLVPRLGG